jgi:hypothetical protein
LPASHVGVGHTTPGIQVKLLACSRAAAAAAAAAATAAAAGQQAAVVLSTVTEGGSTLKVPQMKMSALL